VTALRRSSVDLVLRTVTISAAFVERSNGIIEPGPPKSRAGTRTVAIPEPVVAALRRHLSDFSEDGNDALIFTTPKGRPLRRSNFNEAVGWSAAVAALGVAHLRFHDLRHTGNTLASMTPGISTRDLMERMGTTACEPHSSISMPTATLTGASPTP